MNNKKKRRVSGISFIRYAPCQKIGKSNNLKVPKQDSQHMHEGGEP